MVRVVKARHPVGLNYSQFAGFSKPAQPKAKVRFSLFASLDLMTDPLRQTKILANIAIRSFVEVLGKHDKNWQG